MKNKKHILLLFIFFICIICLIFLLISFNKRDCVVQAISNDIKLDFKIVGNIEMSKNKLFKVVLPDNDFEEWEKYTWKNDINFSDNVIHISGYKEDVNCFKLFVSKELDKIKIKDALKLYDIASNDGKYSKRIKEKIDNINVYYFVRYNNIDTRKSYQFVIEKDKNIYYIEGSYRIGEEEYFKKIVKQVVLSIESI